MDRLNLPVTVYTHPKIALLCIVLGMGMGVAKEKMIICHN